MIRRFGGNKLWGFPRIFMISLVVVIALILALPVFSGLYQGDVLGYLDIIPPYQVIPCGYQQEMQNNGSGAAQAVDIDFGVGYIDCPDQMPAGGHLTWTMTYTYPIAVAGVPVGEAYGCSVNPPMTVSNANPAFPFTIPLGGSVVEHITFEAPASGGSGGLEVTCVTN